MANTAGAFGWEMDRKSPRACQEGRGKQLLQQEFLVFSKQGNDMTGSHFQNSFSRLHEQLKMIPELFFPQM